MLILISDSLPFIDIYWQRFGSEQNANAVLDIAKRITVYNHRLTQSVSLKVAQAPTNSKATWQVRKPLLLT